MSKRPAVTSGKTYKMRTGCGNVFTTVNEVDGKVMEVFIRIGKAGGCTSAQCEAIGRLASLALRRGATSDEVAKQMIGIACHQRLMAVGDDPEVLSCADAIAKALSLHNSKEGEQ